MSELTKKERYDLAVTLDGILGLDLLPEQETALQRAIDFISPEFSAAMMAADDEAGEWFDKATEEDLKQLDNWAKENFPPRKDGRIIRFGGEKKK